MKKKIHIYALLQIIIICSFLGYWVENFYKLFTRGYIDNRFMFLPFLLGYGLFIVAVFLLVGTPKCYFPLMKKEFRIKSPFNILLYFISMAVLVTIGEITLGTVVEKIGGFHYWDYTSIPLHITRYASVPTSLGFATIITLFMGLCIEPLYDFLQARLTSRAFKVATIVICVLMATDFILSFAIMIATGERNALWKLQIFGK